MKGVVGWECEQVRKERQDHVRQDMGIGEDIGEDLGEFSPFCPSCG